MYGTNKFVDRSLSHIYRHPSTFKNIIKPNTYPSRSRRYKHSIVSMSVPQSVVLTTFACFAKATSFCFTYPLESYKIYTQLGKTPTTIDCLYQGFPMFVLLATSQCFLSYNIFFATIEALKLCMPTHLTYMWASIISCFLTSFVKVPLSFVSRNIIFTQGICGISTVRHILTKMNDNVFKTSWLTTLLGDIPDSFVKFYVNDWLLMNIPHVDILYRSCITGILTSIVNTPIDYILTQTLCNFKHFSHILCDKFFIKCMMGVQSVSYTHLTLPTN
jgi:hypothetical protein